MAKLLYLLAFGAALALHAPATAQAGNPASSVTEVRQSPSQTPASQPSPVSANPPSTNLGGTAKSPDRGSEQPAVAEAANAAANSELQALIQDAMGKQPALAGNNVNVSVTAEGIELNGNVSSSRGRLTADRLAHSYAGSKRVINRIVVTERGGSAPPQ